MSNPCSTVRLVCDTSSLMPMVKPRFGAGFFSSSKTVFAIAGSKSFDDKPYRPPTMTGIDAIFPAASASAKVVTTSRYSGSPGPPTSFVRSSTAIFVTVGGSAARKRSASQGR